MLAELATLVAFFVVVEPLLVAFHEAGHALVPLLRGERAFVVLGGDRGRELTVGALTLTVAPRGFLSPITYGTVATDAAPDRRAVVAGALAGPAASVLLLVATGLLLQRGVAGLPRTFALLAVSYLWFQTLFTLVPIRYPGWFGGYAGYQSDGMIALDALRGREPGGE